MNEQLAYLRAVVEGAPEIEPWPQWFGRNSGELSRMFSRSEYLRLKQCRIKAIPEILERFSVSFNRSDRYAWLGGVEGLYRDCGGEVTDTGGRVVLPARVLPTHGLAAAAVILPRLMPGTQQSADTRDVIRGKGAARPLMLGVR